MVGGCVSSTVVFTSSRSSKQWYSSGTRVIAGALVTGTGS